MIRINPLFWNRKTTLKIVLLAFPDKIYKYLSPTNADTLGARNRFSCFEGWINLKRSLLQELRNKNCSKGGFPPVAKFLPACALARK